jgi:hypothetical protein
VAVVDNITVNFPKQLLVVLVAVAAVLYGTVHLVDHLVKLQVSVEAWLSMKVNLQVRVDQAAAPEVLTQVVEVVAQIIETLPTVTAVQA